VLTDEFLPNINSNVQIIGFEIMVQPSEESVEAPILTGDTPAVLQFSGGTTGVPKAALALHRNVVANVIQFKTWLTTLKDGQEVFLTAIPLYHVYGMVIGLNVGIAMGATIVLISNPRDLEGMLKTVEKHSATFFPGVPSIYNAINHYPLALDGQVNLRSIKACISGSAPLLDEVRQKFENLTGGKLVEGFGLSEAPTATHCNPIQGENRVGSIGLPLPDVDCRIVDLEDAMKNVGVGDQGELCIRGPQVMKEYFEMPEESAIILQDGWLHTGDVAKMDADGYFYIVGRIKELIKVNGLQVWPTEVEQVLSSYPGVIEVAAAGTPDTESGESVRAWLVVADAAFFDLQSLKEYCRKNLVSYKIPKEFILVNSLPKSPVGKILRRVLAATVTEGKKESGA
jgi:long-chain acyl-CoA synthetase